MSVRFRSSTMSVLSSLDVEIRDKEAKSTLLVVVLNCKRSLEHIEL